MPMRFRSSRGWINDPNGLVYLDGEYHLFFQHHPNSRDWGPMHWGHAVSKDLMTWEELPIAIYPDEKGYVFSGSVVADPDNKLGLQLDAEIPLIAFFTHHDENAKASGRSDFECQSAAISHDRGRTWSHVSGGPVLPNPGNRPDFRDPFVFWHAESAAWVMVLAAGDRAQIYRSTTLTGWTLSGEFSCKLEDPDSVWECPVLVPVPVETGGFRWLLLASFNPGGRLGGSGTRYWVGSFDGRQFKLAEYADGGASDDANWLDWGPDNYAANAWGNLPSTDQSPIIISWMNNWRYAGKTDELPYRGRMTLPRQLSLIEVAGRLRLRSHIAGEFPAAIESSNRINLRDPGQVCRIDLAANGSGGDYPQIQFLNADRNCILSVSYDTISRTVIFDRNVHGTLGDVDGVNGVFNVERLSPSEQLNISIYADGNSVELLLDEGLQAVTILLSGEDPVDQVFWAKFDPI